jgi:hypothetical protein
MEMIWIKGVNPVVLGKYMRILLIALDVCLLAYIVSHMIYHILPINEPVFWIAVVVEMWLAWLAYRYWMHSQGSRSWNHEKTLAIVLIVVAAAWPSLIHLTQFDWLLSAAQSEQFFFLAILTLLIYSSYVIKPLPKAGKRPSSTAK